MCNIRILSLLLVLNLCSSCRDWIDSGGVQYAMQHGDTNVISRVIAKRGSIDALIDMAHKGKGTMLHIAADQGNLEFVRALLDRGANIDAKSSLGFTALMQVASGGDGEDRKEILMLLLDRGADVSLGPPIHGHALMRAASLGRVEYLKIMLNAGANPHATDREGKTALHVAGSSGVVALLVEAGVDVNTTSFGGETPLDVAQRLSRREQVIEELKKRGGTNNVTVTPKGRW
jgi:ankyrin repeat protein